MNTDVLFSYEPALESKEQVKLKANYGLFIDGEFIPSADNETFTTINPANEEPLTQVAVSGKNDVDKAVLSAQKAFENIWSPMPAKERSKYLFRIARLIQERAKEFAILETLDGGKPIKESKNIDIPLAAQHFFYYAGWADKLKYVFQDGTPSPHGVCGQIIPWNFPFLMAAWKLAPALATGNTCILKPAETTPLTALLLAEVLQEAELPAGVVQILTGASKTGDLIVRHPGIKKIAFTGSTEVGKSIVRSCARNDKKLTLELGGKSAHIIFEDAALDQAVEGVIQGIYFNQGHVCSAGSRLLLQESIQDEFLRKLKKRMELIRVGNPLDKNTDMGAINSREQWQRISDLITIGQSEQCPYFETQSKLPNKGFYHRPSLFTDVHSSHTLNRVEIFGPVLTVSTFRTEDEAIQKANDSSYGLAAGIWSEKSSRLNYISSKLNAGVIWTNSYNVFSASSPFGGLKESGWGREGGIHGLYPYVEVCN